MMTTKASAFLPPAPHGIAEQEARLDLLTNVLRETMGDAQEARDRAARVIERLEELHRAFVEDDKVDYTPGRHSKEAAAQE